MDEHSEGAKKPPPKNGPGYLPRMWKAEPEPAPETPGKKKKKTAEAADTGKRLKDGKAKAKAKKDQGDGTEPKGALVEETPTLDTYQARQTARIITGAMIAGIGFLFVLGIYWAVSGTKDEETAADEALLAQAPSHDPAQAEREARFMISRARDVLARGNVKLTVAFLEKISKSYPNTPVAQEAGAALAAPREELADYLQRAAGVPTGPTPPTRVASGPASPPAAPKLPPGGPQPKPTQPAAPRAQLAMAPNGPARPPSGPAPPPSGPAPAARPPAAPSGAAPPGPSGPAPASTPETGVAASEPAAPGALAANVPNAPAGPNEAQGRSLPAGFRRAPDSAIHPTGWPLRIVCDRDGGTMVFVPGGNYRMGRDDGELSERPAHRVVLAAYYIDQHEVTVRQFDVFQKADGLRSERARALLKTPAADASDDAPATMVTARDAKDYATWAGKELATEAQWEIGARSGDGRLYPWGNDAAHWEKPREFRKIEPVQSHPRDVSPFGAFDMAGNAWEWTKDWFDTKYYNQFRNTPANNPTGPDRPKSEQLAVRGCSKTWSVTQREGLRWGTRLPYLGFRCVLQVEAAAAAAGPAPPAGGGAPSAPAPF